MAVCPPFLRASFEVDILGSNNPPNATTYNGVPARQPLRAADLCTGSPTFSHNYVKRFHPVTPLTRPGTCVLQDVRNRSIHPGLHACSVLRTCGNRIANVLANDKCEMGLPSIFTVFCMTVIERTREQINNYRLPSPLSPSRPVSIPCLLGVSLTHHPCQQVHLLYQQRVRLDRVIRIRSRKPSSSQFSNKQYSALFMCLQYSEELFQYPRGLFAPRVQLDVYELPVEFIIDLRQRHSRIVNACGVR